MLLNKLWRLGGFLLFIFIISGNNIQAQKGSPYITSFSEFDQFDYRIWDMNQTSGGEMVFTSKKGLIVFNGSRWKIHDLNTTPLVIKQNVKNELILTTPGGFGKVFLDSSGTYTYHSLLQLESNEIFGEVVRFGNKLAIIGDSLIYTIDENDEVKKVMTTGIIFPVSGSFSFKKQLHIIARNKMYVLHNDSLIFKKGLVFPLNNDYVFHVESNNEFAYIANTDSKLFRYDGKKFRKIQIKDQKYLDQTILQGGAFLNDSLLGLSTINGGVLIVNIETGKTSYTVNYATGLPDDEVYDIFSKGDNSLWIAHAEGVSRVDLNLPVKMYNHFNGLYGNLQSFAIYKDQFYVGTSEGLFYLKKIQDFATQKVKVKVKPKSKPAKIEVKKPDEGVEEEKDGKKKKRRLRKFFNKFADKITGSSDENEEPEKNKKRDGSPEDIYRTKTIYKLLSSKYEFEQIEKIKGKCLHLLEFNGLLMVGSNTGLYVIKNHQATWLIPNAYINQIIVSEYQKNTLYISANKGLYIARQKGDDWDIKQHYKITDEVNSATEMNENTIVLGDFGSIRVLRNPFKKAVVDYYDHPDFLMENILVRKIEDKILLFSSSNVFQFENNSIKLYDNLFGQNNIDFRIIINQSEYTWFNYKDWRLFQSGREKSILGSKYLSIFDKIENIIVDDKENFWVIDRSNNLYVIDNQKEDLFIPELNLNILSVDNKKRGYLSQKDMELSYTDNAIQVNVSTPFYLKNNAIEYQYRMAGLMDEWSVWTQEPNIHFPFLPPGEYDLKIKSRSVLGNTSDIITLPVLVKKPFTQTTLFFVLVFIAIVLVAYLVIRLRTAKLKHDKRVLEQKVRERTRTISEQKEEIEAQRDSLAERNEEILQQKEEITTQRDEIESQKNQIEEQHNDIKKSITYAERIQRAILQKESNIKKWLPEYFIFWKPRDIVSGDFYWINKVDNKIVVIAADCTGHGVPGAFMSMLGVSFLNEITAQKENLEAHIILNKLRDYVKTTLSQKGTEGEAKDGMDMSLMIFDFDASMAEFAGAFNGLYMIRDGELSDIKADKMPVSIYMKEAESFTKHEIQLQKGDMFYMLSDGFPDQFGGDRGRKFMRKPLKRMFLEIHQKSMEEQKASLDKTLKDWIGTEYQQTDDIIVVGVRV